MRIRHAIAIAMLAGCAGKSAPADLETAALTTRGDYFLQVTVNPNRAFEEGSFDNNTTTIPVSIP